MHYHTYLRELDCSLAAVGRPIAVQINGTTCGGRSQHWPCSTCTKVHFLLVSNIANAVNRGDEPGQ